MFLIHFQPKNRLPSSNNVLKKGRPEHLAGLLSATTTDLDSIQWMPADRLSERFIGDRLSIIWRRRCARHADHEGDS